MQSGRCVYFAIMSKHLRPPLSHCGGNRRYLLQKLNIGDLKSALSGGLDFIDPTNPNVLKGLLLTHYIFELTSFLLLRLGKQSQEGYRKDSGKGMRNTLFGARIGNVAETFNEMGERPSFVIFGLGHIDLRK